MWDTIDFIIKYLIEQGGIWGLLLAIALLWVAWREWTLFGKKKKKEIAPVKSNSEEDVIIIKSRQEDQIRLMEQNTDKLNEVSQKLQDISIHIENFVKMNESNDDKIENLTNQLQQVNDERVEELKEILVSYNSTMNELSLTLQKIKFVLKTRLGED